MFNRIRTVNSNYKKKMKPIEVKKDDEKKDVDLKDCPFAFCKFTLTLATLSIDYTSPTFISYPRWSPNYFRYVDPNDPYYPSYEDSIRNPDNNYSACLTIQLVTNNIRFYATEVLFNRLVPNIFLNQFDIDFIDNIRNTFIAFCLNIEKSNLFYNNSQLTCNNIKVPWLGYFNIEYYDNVQFSINNRIVFSEDIPIVQIDQAILYNLSVNYFANFNTVTNKTPFNISLIIKLVFNQIQVDDPQLTQVNFFEIINFTYSLLTFLFSTSNKLLNGLDPGLPKDFVELYFPLKRQLYYYNTYLTWIQSRNKYLGFGDDINKSNGDATNIQIPNKLILEGTKIDN